MARWTAKTVNNAQGVLNIIFESAVDRDLIQKNPLHRIGMRKVQKKSRNLLTIQEVRDIYMQEWPNESERGAFLLAAVTGMRIGEVVALRPADIGTNYVNVSKNYSEKYGLQDSSKTGINRFVPIPAGFPFPRPDGGWAFPGIEDGKPITGHQIYNAFRRRCGWLGIDMGTRGITIHSLLVKCFFQFS